jgi:hypothetical protein
MTAGTIRKNSAPRKERTVSDANRPVRTAPITVTAATAVGSVVTITFSTPVTLKGVPQYTTDIAGADPVSAALTAPNIVAITFDASVAAATEVRIPFEEKAIRNSSGGFVATSTFPC